MPDPDQSSAEPGLLDAEVQRLRARDEAAAKRTQAPSGFVDLASDPEIAELFEQFAARMPPETAIPFVHYEKRSGVDEHHYGFLGRKVHRSSWTRWEQEEVERGWYLFGHQRYRKGCDKTDTDTFLIHGLGITTDGQPRLVGWRYYDEYILRGRPPSWVIVSGGTGDGDEIPDLHFGRLRGSDLRGALLRDLQLDGRSFPGVKTHEVVLDTPFTYQVWREVSDPLDVRSYLPAYIAHEMAKLIRSAEADGTVGEMRPPGI